MLPNPSQSLIDIGANLTNERFSDDIEGVVERAVAAGVNHIVVTGTSLKDSEQAIGLTEQFSGYLSCTVGIHPHDASSFTASSIDDLKALSAAPRVKAIGETGLDFNRNFSPPDQQVIAFEQQIELACEQQLPLFLHERDAHKRQWEILRHYRDDFSKAVIHCFTGSQQEAFDYLDLDLHIGITGWICDERRGENLQQLVGSIPLNRLMLETDAPYLMPRVKPRPKLRSKSRNEPCTLPYVLAEVAKHRDEDATLIAKQTSTNAIEFFDLNTTSQAN